jgi:hypothetical protein
MDFRRLFLVVIVFFVFIAPVHADDESPVKSKLLFKDKPLINKPVTLAYSFSSFLPGKNCSAKIILPDGFKLVSGNPEWNGEIAGQEKSFEIVVKAARAGYYQLQASLAAEETGYTLASSDTLFVEVTPEDAVIGSRPENHWEIPGQGVVFAGPFDKGKNLESSLEISDNPRLNKEITVTYRIKPRIQLWAQLSLAAPPNAFEIVNVTYPAGGEVLSSGKMIMWKGTIPQNKTVELQVRYRITAYGSGMVYGAMHDRMRGINDVKAADLYLDKYTGYYLLSKYY